MNVNAHLHIYIKHTLQFFTLEKNHKLEIKFVPQFDFSQTGLKVFLMFILAEQHQSMYEPFSFSDSIVRVPLMFSNKVLHAIKNNTEPKQCH